MTTRMQEVNTTEAAALEVQAKLIAADVAEKIMWDDARMQERKARAEIEDAKKEQRKRREAKARRHAVEAEAAAKEESRRRKAAQAAIEGDVRRHARRRSNTKRPEEDHHDEYLATWMKEKRGAKKGKGGRPKVPKPAAV